MEIDESIELHEWKGISMTEIRKNFNTFECQEHLPITYTSGHTILYMLPFHGNGPPSPFPIQLQDKWDQGYVKMPYSESNLCPSTMENGSTILRNGWELIQESLFGEIKSSHQLQKAILAYNSSFADQWNFNALHYFFDHEVDEDESSIFFERLLPKMVRLALQLPNLITAPIPLLRKHCNQSISLSQLQVASLLANAFFCTFPGRNPTHQSEIRTYPFINFNRLFSSLNEKNPDLVMEKLKCIFHYFRRVTDKAPEGIITIERRYIPKENCPKWEFQTEKLPPFHITSRGTIETAVGLLQVDFANKFVGGGVLRRGCVQEEIRFVVCPELLVTMLVTEVLDDTEALVVTGAETYSEYKGYSNTFKWMGNFNDQTPRDSSGRRMVSIVAIDALRFNKSSQQFDAANITRELNKAYAGFTGNQNVKYKPGIATGNWGCGAFRGNPKLKVFLQLMAAAVAERSVAYFTFGDANLRDQIANMYWHLVKLNVDVGRLFLTISQYSTSSTNYRLDFYDYLYKRFKVKIVQDININNHFTNNRVHTSKENKDAVSTGETATKKSRLYNKFSYSSVKEQEEAAENNILQMLHSVDDEKLNAQKSDIKNLDEANEKSQPEMKKEQSTVSNDFNSQESQNEDLWYPEEEKNKCIFNLVSNSSSDNLPLKRLSGLDLLSKNEDGIFDIADKDKSKSEITTTHSHQVSKVDTTVVHKDASRKKNRQRTISEFFVRTS